MNDDDYNADHWTDEPCIETEYGVNCGDPAECCNPICITDDAGEAEEWLQYIRNPYLLTRQVKIIYGPWRSV